MSESYSRRAFLKRSALTLGMAAIGHIAGLSEKALASPQTGNSPERTMLIAYFSHTGNTALVVEKRGRDGAKTMHAHLVFLIAHTPERIEHGRIGNGPFLRADGGEKVCPLPGVFLKFPKNGHRLPGQGHKMLAAHFHAFGRDAPFPGLMVKFLTIERPAIPWDG